MMLRLERFLWVFIPSDGVIDEIINDRDADTTIDVNDAAEIRKRAERIFTTSTYKKQVERSKKNWLDLLMEESTQISLNIRIS